MMYFSIDMLVSILRTNFFGIGQRSRNSFADWLITSLLKKKAINLFDDVFFNPLYIEDFTVVLIELLKNDIRGIFNTGASGSGVSKADFALSLAKVFGMEFQSATVGSVKDTFLGAYRPNDMRMDVTKLEAVYGRKLPSILDGLNRLHCYWKSQET